MSDHGRRLLRKWSRDLHIYLSMLGLLLMLFFALTGFMLNHGEWFGLDQPQVRTLEGTLPTNTVVAVDKLAIVEQLRREFGATGALTQFDTEEKELRVVFKSPGRQSEATVTRADGHVAVRNESYGFNGRLTELHRGGTAGGAWGLVIDAAAILLLISAVTGVVLWLLVPKWRRLGVIALVASFAVCVLVYCALVP